MRAKPPSDAWMLLKSMVESDHSDIAREGARKEFDELTMIVGESAREYTTRAKGLAAAVRHHGVERTNEQLGNRILTGLPSHMHCVCEGFALKMIFSIAELEHVVIKAEELQRRPGASDGHALAAVSTKEGVGPAAGTALEAGMAMGAGTAAEDEVEVDMVDVVSGTEEIIPKRSHTIHIRYSNTSRRSSSHIIFTTNNSSSNTSCRSRSNSSSSFHSRRRRSNFYISSNKSSIYRSSYNTFHNSSSSNTFNRSSSNSTSREREIGLAKGVANPGTSHSGATP